MGEVSSAARGRHWPVARQQSPAGACAAGWPLLL